MTNARGGALLELFQAARERDRAAGKQKEVVGWDELIRGLLEEE